MAGAAGLAGIDAIILAGGLGTRLASVLPNRQKVTAEIDGRPFLARLTRWLQAAGVGRIVLAAGHRADDVEQAAQTLRSDRLEIILSVEPQPLGTGGAARLATGRTRGSPILVLNGDSIAEIDLPALLASHRQTQARATLALVRVPKPGRYGLVELADDGSVRSFREKPDATPESGWINAGIYLFERQVLDALPEGRVLSLERDVFPELIGHGLRAARFEARFIDIGTPASLAAAGSFFRDGSP